MKHYFYLFLLSISVTAVAYQAGPANRTNFGSVQQPATQSNEYRPFSNYNTQNWKQGVRTQTVQTSVAGSSVKEFGAEAQTKPTTGKQAAQAPKPAPSAPAAASAPAANPAAKPTANTDPAAMLQQVQGIMQNMQGLMADPNAKPAASGQTGTPAVPGMPDLSALMGGTMPAAVGTAPAKK